MDDEAAWSADWRKAQPQVLAYCRRSLRNQTDAEDVTQRVALRSWRGYAGFRQDASFVTWALSIARREVIRFVGQRKPEMPSEDLEEEERKARKRSPPAREPPPPPPADALRAACASLEAAGLASAFEHAVLRARLDQPDAGWREIAEEIGGDANSCAVAHCRAIPKLRLHLFLSFPDALGGMEAIADAFAAAQRLGPPDGLSAREADLFSAAILSSNRRADVLIKSAAMLRAACEKVIRRMPMGMG